MPDTRVHDRAIGDTSRPVDSQADRPGDLRHDATSDLPRSDKKAAEISLGTQDASAGEKVIKDGIGTDASPCPSPPTLAAPVLDAYPNPASYSPQAFRGNVVGAALVKGSSGAGTVTATPVVGGRFCIEVPLLPNSSNSVTFQGVDAKGCLGKQTQISITYQPTNLDGGVSAPINAAKKAPITSSSAPAQGQLVLVNDGDYLSFAKFSYFNPSPASPCAKNVWLKVDLGKVFTVNKLKIVWAQGAGNDFAKCYAVLVSTATSPADPSMSSSDWKVVKQNGSNPNANDLVISISPESARWAALVMFDDNAAGTLETFQLAEFEVWGQDPNLVPPPPPDHCP